MSRITEGKAAGALHRWRSGRRWAPLLSSTAFWLMVVVVAGAVALVTAEKPLAGLVLGGLVLVVGVLLADPLLLVVLALPGTLLIQRVGGSSTNLSAADLLVFVGALVALFYVRWAEAPNLRRFMVGIVWFQAALVLSVVLHPFRDNIVEWFHRWSYLGGSVIVGWVIATYGRTVQAFRLFLAGASLLAIIAMEHAVTLHFEPAQWGVYQKNGIGAIMWIAILITQINPPWTGIRRTEARIYKYFCILGLLASQSRQEIILLILGHRPVLRPQSGSPRQVEAPPARGHPALRGPLLQLHHQRPQQPQVQLGLGPGRPDQRRPPRVAPQPDPR